MNNFQLLSRIKSGYALIIFINEIIRMKEISIFFSLSKSKTPCVQGVVARRMRSVEGYEENARGGRR